MQWFWVWFSVKCNKETSTKLHSFLSNQKRNNSEGSTYGQTETNTSGIVLGSESDDFIESRGNCLCY